MPGPEAKQKTLEDIFNNAQDISDDYADNGLLKRKLTDSPKEFRDFLALIREQMQNHGGICKIDAVAPSLISQIENYHRAGLIGAVDGTDALSPTEVSSKTVYAAGVISTTARTLHEPYISLTASHRVIPQLKTQSDFEEFIESLDGFVNHEQSWTRTFREHCERHEALRLLAEDPEIKLVLIDGPIYTQNLLDNVCTRNGILQEMSGQSNKLIGFIKNLQSSKIMHLAGMALQAGEYWTLSNWRNLLINRLLHDSAIVNWISRAASDWCRTVYRKADKAFAFECHPDLTQTSIALVHSRVCCADILNHEIPFLLHAADRIIQARMDARAKSNNLISSSPFYANLANERNFR